MPIRLVFIDDQQREWLVRDGIVQSGKFIVTASGGSFAECRVFDCTSPRERRVYRFTVGQQHGIDESSLERQFRDAKPSRRVSIYPE